MAGRAAPSMTQEQADAINARYAYNRYGYQHGETLRYEHYVEDGTFEIDNVIVDEVLDDTIAVRYENDDQVFAVAYDDVYRPAKSV